MLTRIITALIGIPLVLGVAWLGGPYLLAASSPSSAC